MRKKPTTFFSDKKQLLDTFLKRNTNPKAQYEKSLTDLTLKMVASVEAIMDD